MRDGCVALRQSVVPCGNYFLVARERPQARGRRLSFHTSQGGIGRAGLMNPVAARGDECLETRAFAVNWFKRYVVSFLVAVLFFASIDGYKHPDESMRYGAILLASAGWPVVAALVVGNTIGEAVHDVRQGKAG
jgi:hypothetical protein